jgi:hypothetical protein
MGFSINLADAQQLFTKKLTAVLSDRVEPKAFLRSHFTETESWSLEISTQTSRVAELIAKDTTRGTDGNRNIFGKSTEKLFIPPFYNEYFDITQLDGYNQLYGDPSALISDIVFDRFLQTVADKMMLIQDSIDRAYEKQCGDVFTDGIITLADGSQIDFKRKSESKVTLSGAALWTNAAADPNDVLLQAANFLRITGKSPDATYNVIMGADVYQAYIANAAVLKRGAIFNWNMDRLLPAQRQSTGFSDHGTVSAGSYNFNLLSYPQYFDSYSGSSLTKGTPYIDPKKIIVVPQVCKNVLAYAAVPQLLSTGATPMKGKWFVYNWPDQKMTTHDFGVKSAGVAIPVAVDQIFTAKVLA